MPVTQEENDLYRKFVRDTVAKLGCFDFDPELTLWHYTTGHGLLGMLESGQLHATQVACLNDSTETLYAVNLFRDAVITLLETQTDDIAKRFLAQILKFTEKEAKEPAHSPSKFFVACFTTEKDDLSQWRAYGEAGGSEYGYALAFKARGLFGDMNSLIAKVNYDRSLHEVLASEVAEATLRFYREGLAARKEDDAETWGEEFFATWDEWIYRLSPLIKDDGFKAENEFRIVHELQVSEVHRIRFKQKSTLLARYIALDFPIWRGTRTTGLPLVEAMVGPSRMGGITLISLNTLLNQMGYSGVQSSLSKRPLQRV